jgi:hypothetical protein
LSPIKGLKERVSSYLSIVASLEKGAACRRRRCYLRIIEIILRNIALVNLVYDDVARVSDLPKLGMLLLGDFPVL